MATADIYDVQFGSPQGTVSMRLTYDTTSLVIQQLIYVNPTSQPGTFAVSGPVFNRTITTPANDSRTVDLSSFGVTCVQKQITDKIGTRTVTDLPDGESVQFTWPT